MDHRPRPRGAHLRDAGVGRLGHLRPHALVRGAGESQEQPRDRDLRRRRPRDRFVFRREPLLRAVRRPLSAGLDATHIARRPRRAAHRGRADLDRGRAFPPPLGHRHPVAVPRGNQDCGVAEPFAGRRQHHYAAARQEPLSARHGAQPKQGRPHAETRAVEVQGVDYGSQARTQLHQGGNRGHVSQHRRIRLQRLRHKVGREHLFQQGARRAERSGGRRAGGRGERPHALLARAKPRQRSGTPQSGAQPHARRGSHLAPRVRLALGTAHNARLQTHLAQRRRGDLFPRDAASGDEHAASRAASVPHRLGLRAGGEGVRRKSALRLVPQEQEGRRHAV